MKVIQRGIMKVVPGKMVEAMKLMEKHKTTSSRLGAPIESMRVSRRLSGGGDVGHTIVFKGEWDSLAAMEAFFDKCYADPEMQTLIVEWDKVTENQELEILMQFTKLGYLCQYLKARKRSLLGLVSQGEGCNMHYPKYPGSWDKKY